MFVPLPLASEFQAAIEALHDAEAGSTCEIIEEDDEPRLYVRLDAPLDDDDLAPALYSDLRQWL